MWRILVALGALAACSDETHVEPVAAAATPPVVTAKPKPPAYDSSIPAKPAMFGPWASIPFGTSYTDIDKTAPWLVDVPRTSEDDATVYAIGDMFAGVVTNRFVAAIVTVAPDRLGGWGPPIKIRDELGHGITHELWFDAAARIRIDRQGNRLVIQPYLPLAQFFGHGRFTFEGSRSLLGLSATEATDQIQAWATSIHATTRVEGGAQDIAKSIGHVTHSSVDASNIIVVGPGGKTTPLAAMPTTSMDVYVPMTEWNFSSFSYASTQIRLWFDDAGHVRKFWFSTFVPTKREVDALRSRLAAAFGPPVTKDDHVRYGSGRIVCTRAGERGYFSVTVGDCD